MDQQTKQLDSATLIEKKVRLNQSEILRYQVWHYCFMNNIILNHTELLLLSLVGEMGKVLVIDFCKEAVKRNIFSTLQAAQTAMSRLYRIPILKKEGTGRKTVYLDPAAQILSKGNRIINIQLIYVEPDTVKRHSQKTSAALEHA